MEKRLIVITDPEFQGALSLHSVEGAKAFLFHPKAPLLYVNGRLFDDSEWLSLDETIRLAKVRENNLPLPEPVLLVGIWSYLIQHGLHIRSDVETTEHKLSVFMGLSVGRNGFNLKDKLTVLNSVYGIIPGKGMFPFLEGVEERGNQWVLKSHYLYELLKMIKACKKGKRYYSLRAYASLVSAKNKNAAMIVLELVRLVAKAGENVHNPHISLSKLAERIPALHEMLYGDQPMSIRQKKLRRAFQPLIALKTDESEAAPAVDPDMMPRSKKTFAQNYTSLSDDYVGLHIALPELHVSNPKAVITVYHNGLNKNRKKG